MLGIIRHFDPSISPWPQRNHHGTSQHSAPQTHRTIALFPTGYSVLSERAQRVGVQILMSTPTDHRNLNVPGSASASPRESAVLERKTASPTVDCKMPIPRHHAVLTGVEGSQPYLYTIPRHHRPIGAPRPPHDLQYDQHHERYQRPKMSRSPMQSVQNALR